MSYYTDDCLSLDDDDGTVLGTIKKETLKAYLVSFAKEKECWIPKSLAQVVDAEDFELNSYITLPMWFIEKEGLDLYMRES